MKRCYFIVFLLLILILSACSVEPMEPVQETPTRLPETQVSPRIEATLPAVQVEVSNTPIPKHEKKNIWINPLISEKMGEFIKLPDTHVLVENPVNADIQLDMVDDSNEAGFTYYYVLSVPFTQFADDISFESLKRIWSQPESEEAIYVDSENDLILLEYLLGTEENPNLFIGSELPFECPVSACYRISGFEEVVPQWKVIMLDGVDLLDRDAYLPDYPLKLNFDLHGLGDELSNVDYFHTSTNFDKSKLSIIALTGTTALTRGTAYQMEMNGVLFPIEDIKEILDKADILHISNEVPMFTDCPPAVPLREEMRFCSSPNYLKLFNALGVDVIELTGNHLWDWGEMAFVETLNLYQFNDFEFYGAGRTLSEAEAALEIEDHGNRIVFLGCNVSGPANIWANEEKAGVNQCDLERLLPEIEVYRAAGYLPIVTFQHYEFDDFTPPNIVKNDFWAAAESGAVIVSGSQAHFPQGFDFVGDSFIDYGVGNLFFDQMANWYRKATIDFHYFYDGSYINTQVIPIINEDQGKPRIMTEEESQKFLGKMYENSFYYEN